MAEKVRKEEMRVFVEPWLADTVRAEIGRLGVTESEVVRTILLDWARLGFRKMPVSYFLLKPNVQKHEICINAGSRLCASCQEDCVLAGTHSSPWFSLDGQNEKESEGRGGRRWLRS